jgi:hypothetical protein
MELLQEDEAAQASANQRRTRSSPQIAQPPWPIHRGSRHTGRAYQQYWLRFRKARSVQRHRRGSLRNRRVEVIVSKRSLCADAIDGTCHAIYWWWICVTHCHADDGPLLKCCTFTLIPVPVIDGPDDGILTLRGFFGFPGLQLRERQPLLDRQSTSGMTNERARHASGVSRVPRGAQCYTGSG